MWGWRIRIGDLFSADYTPIPPQYLWKKKITKEGEETNSTTFGVAYQSVLSNITWIDKGNSSPFIQKLQRAMKQVNISGKNLSIRFNLDMYETYSRKNTFTTGRITGISFFRLFIFYILYFPRGTTNQKHYPDLGQWPVISTEFLRSFLRRHLAGKPVVASPNVGCQSQATILVFPKLFSVFFWNLKAWE